MPPDGVFFELTGEEHNMKSRIAVNWIVAIAVAIVYLAVSIPFGAWAYSWVIWALYAVYRFAQSRIAGHNG